MLGQDAARPNHIDVMLQQGCCDRIEKAPFLEPHHGWRRGHDVVEAPGPGVAFMRVALTDLYLKKKPGKQASGYTAIGAHTSEEMMQTMLEFFDVVEVAFQLEVLDVEAISKGPQM